ncbi:MAG: sigma-70 family RNA polymerase sigma factor [Muribaculaceae bacterium]|nr:sigma-70 family RNA polymerase sigma factor [Muribaculaceae bacterium]
MTKNYTELPDDRLVAEYAQGDNVAFDTLLLRHQAHLFSYIISVVRDHDIADDIFQECFVKAIITIRQGHYSANGKFAQWIMRIAHNLIIDFYRQKKSENTVSVDCCETDILNRKELSDTNIEDFLVSSQINDDLHSLIDNLPSNQREVLGLHYYHDMSFKEIADATHVSINTALGRARYGLINIRRSAERNHITLSL